MAWQSPAVFLLWLLGSALPVAADEIITLRAGSHKIVAEIAAAPVERARGLMGREQLTENHGMLFVFPSAGIYAMWMKDTRLPLAAAFLDENGMIVDIAEMQPYSLTEHRSRKPVKYVLEMDCSWFRQHGVRVGTRIRGLPQSVN